MSRLDDIPRQKGHPNLLVGGGLGMGTHNQGNDPTQSPSRADMEWAAGYLEGDGSFGVANRTGCVTATSKDPWPVREMRGLFGGAVGDVNGYKSWNLYGARARGLMMSIYPLMSSKRQRQIAKAMGVEYRPVLHSGHSIHWAAGIFEAEGTAYWATTTNRVEVSSTDREPLEHLYGMAHGTIQERKRPVTGRPGDTKVRRRWYATGCNARAFAMTVFPLCSPRRQQQIRTCLRCA